MKEIVMGLALGLAAGFVCGGTVVGSLFQNDAIEHNCAEYDVKTGEWGWKYNNTYDDGFLDGQKYIYEFMVCLNASSMAKDIISREKIDCSKFDKYFYVGKIEKSEGM